MNKKVLGIVLAAVMVASAFTGCGGTKQNKSDANSTVATSKKELGAATIKFWFPSEGEVNDKYFIDVAKEFEAKYPQIKVEVTKLPTAQSDVELKLNAAQLSSDYPDVLSAYLIFIATRGAKDEFADLKSYIDNWDEKNDIDESALSMGTYKGKQLGIGFYPSPQMLVYRTDYFKEAGLDPAKPPKNWDELKDYAFKLVKKDSTGNVVRAGFDVPAMVADVFFKPFMRQAGSQIVDEKNEKPSFTDKGAIEAFEFLASLKDQSIPHDYSKKNDSPFMKGNAAMGIINVSQINLLYTNDPTMKDKLAFAPVLEKTNKVSFCGNRFFTVGESSKYKDQSFEFIKFLMSKEQSMKRAKDLNIPVVRKSLEKDYIALNPVLNTAILDNVKYGKGQEQVAWSTALTKYLRTAYEEVYNKKKTAEQALKDADASLNKEITGILSK